MPIVPSKNFLIKDVIGSAIDLIQDDDVRRNLKSVGIEHYNSAIIEVYNIIDILGQNTYLKKVRSIAGNTENPTGTKNFIINLSHDSFKDINLLINVICYNHVHSFEVSEITNYKEFSNHLSTGEASYPHNKSGIYCLTESHIDILLGEDVKPKNTTFDIIYKRNPSLVNSTTYATSYMDIPDIYFPLLRNRIASYAEMRKGIKDNAFAMWKMTLEQMLLPLEEEKRKLILMKLGGENA